MANKAINDLLKYGAKVLDFVQPTLSSNGTLGVGNFAVSATAGTPYLGADNNPGTGFEGGNGSTPGRHYWYSKNKLKISSISIKNHGSDGYDENGTPIGFYIYGSNDVCAPGVIPTDWTQLYYGTNSTTNKNATWSIPVNSTVFYKYIQLYCVSSWGYAKFGWQQATLIGKELIL